MIVAVIFTCALLIGVPIALVLGLSGMAHMLVINPDIMLSLPQKLFVSANSYGLMAIPLFILAGELMELSGDVDRLCNLSRALVGHIKGGLCYVTILLGTLLGAPLGSANAEAALLSSTLYPELRKDGYGESFSGGLIASVSCIGPMIPPGMLFVIYGVVSGVSIKDLFLAGVMPGIYMAIALTFVIFMIGRNKSWPVGQKQGFGSIWTEFKRAVFSLLTPALTLICIALGITTATEAAAVMSMLILIVGVFVYRKITIKQIIPVLLKSAVAASAVLMIGAMGGVFGYTLALDQIPTTIANVVTSLSENKFVILLLINVLLLIAGMLMDAIPLVIILVPVFLPIISQYGYNPVHFGLIVCLNLTIGLLTPPVGTVLYTTASATGMSAGKMIKGIWPWLFVLIVVLLFITYVPQSIMFIPDFFAQFD